MLHNTFVHLSGIGSIRERELWNRGILDWDRFLGAISDGLLRERVYRSAVPTLHESLDAINKGDIGFFKTLLPESEIWRVYPQFAKEALFLDIETTGFVAADHEVTMIATLASGKHALFVKGINLDEFPTYIARFPLLVTFNGSQFDLPFLRTHFPDMRLDQSHVDLRFVLTSLGYEGGLKTVEHAFGIRRDPAIESVNGLEAVRLWYRYRQGEHCGVEITRPVQPYRRSRFGPINDHRSCAEDSTALVSREDDGSRTSNASTVVPRVPRKLVCRALRLCFHC